MGNNMKNPKGQRTPKTPVKRQRPSYSCTECTRRKLRCSKRIPCLACIERGIEAQCRLRGRVSERRREKSISENVPDGPTPHPQPLSNVVPNSSDSECHPPQSNGLTPSLLDSKLTKPELQAESLSHPSCSLKSHKILDTVSQDAAIMLEFLALSRQQILSAAQLDQPEQKIGNAYSSQFVDLVFSAAQVDNLMSYHEEYIAWIHNVVHMPTFRQQCMRSFEVANTSTREVWLPLYYAMLSVTLYHTHPSKLQEFEIFAGVELSLLCYQKSIDSLNAVDFMKNHNIYSVQAICLLIYIGHNSGQSDRVSVLLASASRIAQCLGIHRLGLRAPSSILHCSDSDTREQLLIDREVSKRAWWFLVRQDWLQIPFNNTYNIHPSQSDTPMPINCYEEVSKMVSSSGIVEQNKDTCTQGSYTSVLNKGAVIIWNLQDRMCQKTKSTDGNDGGDLRNLYSEVLQADRELKELVSEMPQFYKPEEPLDGKYPTSVIQQSCVLSVSIAHKFYSIHRHFQISSLKDPWFAYTKLSCLPLMRRCLMDFLSLTDDPCTYIVSNIWTVNAQVLTAAVWLLFELIFSKDDNVQIFETNQIRDLILRSLQFLQVNQGKSTIAKRGVALIESLLDTEGAIKAGTLKHFSLKEIISRVEVDNHPSGPNLSIEPSFDPSISQMTDLLFADDMAWEDIFNVFDM